MAGIARAMGATLTGT